MALKIGIVGLPNVGKSTLFNALTGTRGASAENYPFCTIDPNIGIVEVPDERMVKLASFVQPEQIVPATVEFVDIAGLVKGASKGEGLGNQFLAAIREVHAICHVVRAFEDGDITHVDGTIDTKRDRETIEMELILSDLDILSNRIDKTEGSARSGDKEKIKELALLEKLQKHLQDGNVAITLDLDKDEKALMRDISLLTYKPILYAINVSEEQLTKIVPSEMKQKMELGENEQLILISAKIEEDLHELNAEERKEYLKDLNTPASRSGWESGLDQLIHAAYKALGYITYFTAGPKEVRAWTVTEGATAPQAAGVIHTDFERGFIRAETISYDDYINYSGESGAKEAGKVRQEGKEYIVKDGDVMHFKFNV